VHHYMVVNAESGFTYRFGPPMAPYPGCLWVIEEGSSDSRVVRVLGTTTEGVVIAVEYIGQLGAGNHAQAWLLSDNPGEDRVCLGVCDSTRKGLGLGRLRAWARKEGWI
jgi:hypothetical protein